MSLSRECRNCDQVTFYGQPPDDGVQSHGICRTWGRHVDLSGMYKCWRAYTEKEPEESVGIGEEWVDKVANAIDLEKRIAKLEKAYGIMDSRVTLNHVNLQRQIFRLGRPEGTPCD